MTYSRLIGKSTKKQDNIATIEISKWLSKYQYVAVYVDYDILFVVNRETPTYKINELCEQYNLNEKVYWLDGCNEDELDG